MAVKLPKISLYRELLTGKEEKIAENIAISGTIDWQRGQSQKWVKRRLRTRTSSKRAVDRIVE